MKKILVIEDDENLNEGICLALQEEQMQFYQCSSCKEGRLMITQYEPDLILLDLNLSDGNGLVLLKEIRNQGKKIPVIIITANNMEIDIVKGLEMGANDYITKPFSLMVLRARVKVQLRTAKEEKSDVYDLCGMHFDFEKMRFLKENQEVILSKTEQRVLRMLVVNQGRTLTRNQLLDYVWDGDEEFVDEHALTVTVKRLRDKLEKDSSKPEYIKTIYGIGYQWTMQEDKDKTLC